MSTEHDVVKAAKGSTTLFMLAAGHADRREEELGHGDTEARRRRSRRVDNDRPARRGRTSLPFSRVVMEVGENGFRLLFLPKQRASEWRRAVAA